MNALKLQGFLLFVLFGVLVTAVHSSAAESNRFGQPDKAVLKEFDDTKTFIADLSPKELQKGIRNSLIKQIEKAKSAYERKQPCTAVNILGAFLNHTNALIDGKKVLVAEELRNRGWMLRYNLLANLPSRMSCRGFENIEAGSELNTRVSNNKRFGGSVSFGTVLLETVQSAGELWTQVEIPSLQSLVGAPGMPAVPAWHALLGIPMNAKVRLKKVVTKIDQEIPVHLYPFQEQPADSLQTNFETQYANQPFQINQSAYAQKAFYPDEPCSIAILGQARDLTIAQLTCSAGQYNPSTRLMRLFSSIEFEVVFEGGNGTFVSTQTLSPFEKSSESAMAVVANRAVLQDYVASRDLDTLPCYGEELLILTHPDFKDAANDLADWKREKGISTTVVQVGDGTNCDDADKIDELIEWRYDNCTVRPSYILLLGDVEYIPPARTDVDTSDACGTCNDTTTGSDYAYAMYPQFFFDIFPDFAVARIPVDTIQEAQLVVDKIIQYESDPPFIDLLSGAPFYTTTSNAAAFQCCRMNQDGSPRNSRSGTDQRAFIGTSELVRDYLTGLGYSVERIYTETVDSGGYCLDNLSPCTEQQAYTGNTTPNRYFNGTLLPADLRSGSGFAWGGVTQDIINAYNEGRFLVLHRDHGLAVGLSHPVFNIYNISSLENDEFLPVVYSVSCLSGFFDRETDAGITNECFMEQLLIGRDADENLVDGGMIGGLAANRESPTWANDAMTRGFYDATWSGIVPEFGDEASKRRLGDILNHAKMYLLTQIGVDQTAGDVSFEAALGNLSLWHAFGDPTLEMWTSNPLAFVLGVVYMFDLYEDHMLVRYDTAGAIITALQQSQNGTVPVGRATVKNGVATIHFFSKPLAGMPIKLSASFDNAVSVQLAEVPFGPDLAVEEIQLDSIQLEPGTDLKDRLKVKVGNRGSAESPGTVNSDGSVKDPPQGYMIDLVLSTDTNVPEGFAKPADQVGAIFEEDALLVGGRVSRTPDVPAMGSIILSTASPVSSDVGDIIPLQTPPGSYHLCARIDPGGAIQETDESNNLTCLQVTVGNQQAQ